MYILRGYVVFNLILDSPTVYTIHTFQLRVGQAGQIKVFHSLVASSRINRVHSQSDP
jgi:hypothetical protein